MKISRTNPKIDRLKIDNRKTKEQNKQLASECIRTIYTSAINTPPHGQYTRGLGQVLWPPTQLRSRDRGPQRQDLLVTPRTVRPHTRLGSSPQDSPIVPRLMFPKSKFTKFRSPSRPPMLHPADHHQLTPNSVNRIPLADGINPQGLRCAT